MKQHITQEQWGELNEKQKQNYREWAGENVGVNLYTKLLNVQGESLLLPALSIGQMIEFLGNDWMNMILIGDNDGKVGYIYTESSDDNLCDSLWEACKDKLK